MFLDYLPGLVKNPLIITGALMALAVVIYFSLEHRHIIHKTKGEKAFLFIGWGVFLAVIAVISLFTTSLNFLANSAGFVPDELTNETYTLDKANNICTEQNQNLTQEYKEGCEIVQYSYYGAYIALIIALLLLILGFFKRMSAAKAEKKAEKIETKPEKSKKEK